MVDLNTISDSIEIAKAYYVQLLNADLQLLYKGCCSKNSGTLTLLNRLFRALASDVNGGFNDAVTQKLYNCLLKISSPYNGVGLPFDPEVIIPGYVKPPVIIIEAMDNAKIPFATTDEDPSLILSDYQTNYAPRFGNNPIINLYQNNGLKFPQEMQVPDSIDYQDADYTKNLLGMTWDFAIGTTGYIQIWGQPNGSIIPPINPNPPIIDAGADQNITLPTNTATLTATGSNFTGLLWTQLSGPVTAGISTPNALVTAITALTTAGTYVFKITATNVGNVRSDVANVVVSPQIDYVFSGIKADGTPLSEASIQIGTQTAITANTNYNVNFGSFGGTPQYAWFAELSSEPIKVTWTDSTNPLNTGGIGGGGNLFGTPIIVGAYRFYITNYATIINAPFTFTQ